MNSTVRIGLSTNPEKNIISIAEIEALPNAGMTEIDCDLTLDRVGDRSQVLTVILKKLRKGGRLIIKGNDVDEIARLVHLKLVSQDNLLPILYNGRQSISSVNLMVSTLKQAGLKILNARMENAEYFIVAERPK